MPHRKRTLDARVRKITGNLPPREDMLGSKGGIIVDRDIRECPQSKSCSEYSGVSLYCRGLEDPTMCEYFERDSEEAGDESGSYDLSLHDLKIESDPDRE